MHTQLTDQSVIVIRGGGRRDFRRNSLRSGSNVYHALRGHTNTHDVHLQPDGQLLHKGKPVRRTNILQSHAVIFNSLHANAAGQLARLCRRFSRPHTGNTHLHRAIYRQPHESRHVFRNREISTIPHWTFTDDNTEAHNKLYTAILENITYPVILFPLPDSYSGNSLTVRSEKQLLETLRRILSQQPRVQAQRGMPGSVYSLIVMPEFRNTSPYVFPAFRRRKAEIANRPEEPLNASVSKLAANGQQKPLQNFAGNAYEATDLSCLARIDVLETEGGDLYLSHIEPHPDLSRHSLLAKSADRVGVLMRDVFKKQVETARK